MKTLQRLFIGLGALLSAPLIIFGTLYLDLPPPAHTGGFGEPTCHVCHSDLPLNAPGGTLELLGVPSGYSPGHNYTLTILLSKQEMMRGGFQLSARFLNGKNAGKQAGAFSGLNDKIKLIPESNLLYLHHSVEGAELTAPDSVRWDFEWNSPENDSSTVVFHIAANAANWNDSESGDYIYTLTKTTKAIRKKY